MKPSDASPTGEADRRIESGGAGLFDEVLVDLLERRYLVLDARGRVSRWSSEAERLLGWREEEVSGRCAIAPPLAWGGDGLAAWQSHLESPRDNEPPLRSGLVMLCRDAAGLPVETIAVPVPLRLGFEFTMLVGDLAIGGPGSHSVERLVQVHKLATDAIAIALSEESTDSDPVAGLLITFRPGGDKLDLGDPNAQHAARALAIEIEQADETRAAEPEPGATATLLEELPGAREAMEQVSQLGTEVDRLRTQLAEESDKSRSAAAESDRLAAELARTTGELGDARAALEGERHEREAALAALAQQLKAELEDALRRLEETAGERDEIRDALAAAILERDDLQSALEFVTGERDELQAVVDAAAAGDDEAMAEADRLRAKLAQAEERLAKAIEERDEARADMVGIKAYETTRRDELEQAIARCDELSAALAERTAELEALPRREAMEAAKAERDQARAALAEAFAERDAAQAALDAAHQEREEADAALRRAEEEREERIDELRTRLEEAEAAAEARATEAKAARERASEERERAMDAVREAEAVALERARVSELESRISELETELDQARARAEEHDAHDPGHDPWTQYRPAGLDMRPALDDVDTPRAHIGWDGHFIALNAAFCDLVSYSEFDFRNAYWPPVIDSANRDRLRRAGDLLVAGEIDSAEVDTFYMSGNGTLVRVLGTLRAERDGDGTTSHLVLDAAPRSDVKGWVPPGQAVPSSLAHHH
jgi:PAS fold